MNNSTLANATIPSLEPCEVSKPVNTDFGMFMYSWVIFISIIGNILLICVVMKNKRMHTVANYLICNTSVADLLITFLPMIWEVVHLKYFPDGAWPMGRFMCSFLYMCIYLSVACSILSLTAITCDRFFAIIFPMKRIITKRGLPYILLFIWVTSISFASPVIYAQDLVTISGMTYCVENWKPPFHAENSPLHYTIILFVGLYALPLITMAVMYSAIIWKLWTRNIPGNRSSDSEKQSLGQKKKVVKLLVTVVCVFAVCWLPVFVMQFIYFTSSYYQRCPSAIPKWLQFWAFFFQYFSSAVNPYIYFAFSGSYRRGLRSVLPRCCVSNQIEAASQGGSRYVSNMNTLKQSRAIQAADSMVMSERQKITAIKEESTAGKQNDNGGLQGGPADDNDNSTKFTVEQ